jgi:prefoldin alpha subunit
MSAGGNPQLQELAQQLEELEKQREAIESEIQALQGRKQDINEAITAIEELDTDSTVQVPIGGGAYVRATIEDIEEITVELGGGYAADRSGAGAIDTLETKQDTLDDRIEELQSDVAELETETEELEQRAQQLQMQQMQQQQRPQDE